MNLKTALLIYETEGPHDSTNREQTARFVATKVVHLYLDDTERLELMKSWRAAPVVGKGGFFAKLSEVRQRLESAGFLQ